MGSASSLQALPEVLNIDQVRMLCGASFNEQEFNFLAQGGNTISKDDFLAALHNKTDVFLTHDWGRELGQDNHARVAEINRRLQARGLTTWFDSEQMEGNVKKQMALGIDNAQCIIAFITKRYIDKVGGFNAEDNCQLEFNYAARRKTASRMIPVVMEDRVRNTGTWDGEVGLVLGGRLYVDMCGDVYDDVYSEQCIDDLYAKIIKIIKTPIKGLNSGSTIVVNNTSPEDMPTQDRPTPKKQQKNVKPLTELTVDEVSKLLEFNKLSKFASEMKDNDVDGPTLMETNNDEELKELGISLGVKARMFYKKLEMYKFHGVPFAELGIEEVNEKETKVETQQKSSASLVQHGDGTFTIAGATGGFKNRVNGTFEIGDDMQNGLPVYVKVGDPDTVIDLVKGISGWRWYIKQLKDKGPDSSSCYAYAQCVDEDMKLASQTDPSMWWVHEDGKFGIQSTLTVTPSSSLPPPANIMQLLNQARTTIKKAKEDEIAEEKRAPYPGAFTIAGCDGKNPKVVNGTFEPTKESQNGFPVYRKKGNAGYWVEMVYKPTSGWRWYLKPTANKGPDSSICFAYFQCNEDDIKLPQDCAKWHVSTTDGFKQQDTCQVTLANSQPLPADVTSRYAAGLAIVKDRKASRIAEQTQGVIPGTFTLSGATGTREGRFNGSYEPSGETQNNFPVYKKKGDPDSWIELVHGASGWRWYLKPTANKGPDSSICFAYYQCDEKDVKMPSEVTDGWYVHGTGGFAKQSTKMTVDSTAPLPAHLQETINEGKAKILKAYADKQAEQTRGAVPGSFRIEGATGKSMNSINNTFEPSIQSQNGFPRYKVKSGDNLWVEAVYKSASGWRWYLKPTANLGPDSSICFAYCSCDENDIKLPGDMSQWYCSTADGFVIQSTVKVSRLGGDDSQDVLNRLGEGRALALKMKTERLAEMSRGAVQGSFQIDGATGKSKQQTNGVYEPTTEVQNGMPIYKKKGTGDMWIELVHKPASGWRWYLKPTANKGPDSSICFAYFTLSGNDVKLPIECKDSWTTNTADGFKAQKSIKVTVVGDAGQPPHVQKLLSDAAWKTLH